MEGTDVSVNSLRTLFSVWKELSSAREALILTVPAASFLSLILSF